MENCSRGTWVLHWSSDLRQVASPLSSSWSRLCSRPSFVTCFQICWWKLLHRNNNPIHREFNVLFSNLFSLLVHMGSGVLEPGRPICALGYSSSSRETGPEKQIFCKCLSWKDSEYLTCYLLILFHTLVLGWLPLYFPSPSLQVLQKLSLWTLHSCQIMLTWPKGSEVLMGVGWVDRKSCGAWLCRSLILRTPGQKSCLPSFPLLWKP